MTQSALNQARRAANREIVRTTRESGSCVICGERDPDVLEFHHRDPAEKVGRISSFANRMTEKRLREELAKCVIVCANDHRRIHAGKITLPGSGAIG